MDTSTNPQDLMNDPQDEQGGEDGSPDTCRICREKGSDAEPLFHPCKCNGSIKHVHQDCLMEWLSHSQKKHCELCKTPFRFTKLYSPNMPQSLPPDVFFRHFILHSIRNLATWLRFCLVCAVWLAILPYTIRWVWRGLFWLSDGGWPADYHSLDPLRNSSARASTAAQVLEVAQEIQLASNSVNGSSPATPLYAAQTTSASVHGLMEKLVNFLIPLSTKTSNSTGASDPLAAGLLQSIYRSWGSQSRLNPQMAMSNVSRFDLNISTTTNPCASIFSDVQFLKNLTRYTFVNNTLIMIAEGYVITILVVVAFILVFLIREWVVQQQPDINMGAGFNADLVAPNREQEAGNQENGAIQAIAEAAPQERVIAQPRARRNALELRENAAAQLNDPKFTEAEAQLAVIEATGLVRPTAVRDALTPAAEIQKRLQEEPKNTTDFLAIWRRAESNPDEVLKIIERENRGEEMAYWVNAMKLIGPSEPEVRDQGPSTLRQFVDANRAIPRNDSAESLEALVASKRGSGSDESWIDIRTTNTITAEPLAGLSERSGNLSSTVSDKGKGKAKEDLSGPPLLPRSEGSSISRPRAASDGPQRKQNASLLGNNSWAFNDLDDIRTHDSWSNSNPTTKFLGDSAMNFPQGSRVAINGDVMGKSDSDVHAWREAQDARVQDAFAKARGARGFAQVNSDPVNDQSADLDRHVEIRGQDGLLRIAANWDEEFANNPVDQDEHPEENLPLAGTPLPQLRDPIIAVPAEPQGLVANVADWLWGGPGDLQGQDTGTDYEHIVEDLALEAPFVPVPQHDDFDQGDNFVEQDRDVVEAALAAGLDPNDADGIDDAEDFEGIMELIGMRGPIQALFQNVVFSAFLLSLTVAFGIWIPYQIGRIFLLLAVNPGPACKLPLRFVYWFAAFMQDIVVSVAGVASYCAMWIISFVVGLWSENAFGLGWQNASLRLSAEAIDRIKEGTLSSLLDFTDSEIFAFSAASHEALLILQYFITDTLEGIGRRVTYMFVGDYSLSLADAWFALRGILGLSSSLLIKLPGFLVHPDFWMINLEHGKREVPLDLELSVWGTMDRVWATLAGYTALSLLGVMYVRKGSPFSNGQAGRDWEATIIDLLNQAGGVMKVILIISIEMLVFPLYCGLLLDAALLPLFEGATIMSRLLFTIESPLTSIFVHWFVGTCYMFHFALFVSMCRKIMRKGVLYFIRDPDDPTFHPVRDVLERNVATQLRKILFSALVYGALVVICLGGVVWGLAFAFRGVLPIHWSSNEPVLEFPVDLLFYNFLMPLAVRFFKPSDGLHAMYSWWFRQCARMLRLTWFMFDERRKDEEGHVVRRSWQDFWRGFYDDSLPVETVDHPELPFINDSALNAYVRRDGMYVRAPASDQVRVKKGYPIFLEVDEANQRLEGQPDRPNGDANWDSDLYKQVYIPPNFRLRIFAFIVSIWLFAALTGVCITIVPLVFGREVFSMIIPTTVRKNDVYAFSIGIYILGSLLYMILHARDFFIYLTTSLYLPAKTPGNILRQVSSIASHAASVMWTYSAVLFLLPTLCAFLTEFYAIVPLHTYFFPDEPHTIHFVQSWTLGLLYVKLTTRLIQCYPDSRLAASLRLIVRDGYLNPNARLATRSFILPATVMLSIALLYPWLLARFAVLTFFKSFSEPSKTLVYRYAYPAVLCGLFLVYTLYLLGLAVRGWKMRIRDEVYLVGERLHNFGERKPTGNGITGIGVRRIET